MTARFQIDNLPYIRRDFQLNLRDSLAQYTRYESPEVEQGIPTGIFPALYDATTSENRTRYLALFNAGNGISAGIGALLGGYLSPHLPAVMGYQTLALFLISGVLRGSVALAFLPWLKEVRKVDRMPASQLFHVMMGGHPVNRRLSHRGPSHLHHHERP